MRKRNNRIVFYLNNDELKELGDKIEKTHYPREVFLRKVITDGTVRAAPPADYPKLIRALGQVGNNLNQLTATANSIHFIDPKELNAVTKDLKHIMQRIHQSFQIPDQKRVDEKTVSDLQYIYEEVRNVLEGQSKDFGKSEILQFIRDAVAAKAMEENRTLWEYRNAHPAMLLGFLDALYTPFAEKTEDT